MSEFSTFLGLVQNYRFVSLEPRGLSDIRLTTIPRQAAMTPEAQELDLAPYEGQAVMAAGYADSGWIYSAAIIDHAGPILTAIVRKLFESPFNLKS